MPVYTPGGGGGPSREFDENPTDAVSKPYDVSWPMNADQLQQINEMFDILFKSNVKRHEEISALQNTTVSDSSVLVAERTFTVAEMNNLLATPINIVEAQGAGTIIVPLSFTFEENMGASGFSGAKSPRLEYEGLSVAVSSALALDNTANRYVFHVGEIVPANQAANAVVVNKALQITYANADTSGGSGSFRFTVAYYVMTSL